MTMRDVEPDGVVDDRYLIESHIGSGGMADVYCATDQQLGRKVALKLLYRRFAQDPEFVERFRREASAAAGLQHPNVVSVYDRGEWEGTYYIAMEYLEGASLKEVVRREGSLPPERAIDITIQILKAARFAHRRGIIHRDLKPHNVIVDEEDRAKVTDFGIARAGASDMTETGSIMGTAQYLSPEQAQGRGVSAQSDLYSIGILLYELLCGHVPFEADSAVTIALKQVSEAPVPPSQVNPDVPPELEDVVLQALEKEPSARFADADAFIAALEAVRDGAAVGNGRRGTSPSGVWAVSPAAAADGDGGWTGQHASQTTGYYEPPRGRRWWQHWWVWLIAALVVLAGLAGAYAIFAPEKVEVPKVVGLKNETAAAKLANEGLEYDIKTVNSERVPKDRVIRQDPEAGEKINEDSTVTLTVSAGPGKASIPTVQNLTRARARSTLRGAGFRVREQRRPSESVAEGRAIGTDPEAGTDYERQSTVTLLLSSGPEKIEVPSVVGRSADEAERQLSDLGLEVGARKEEESSDEDPGTVLAQSITAGTEVDEGTAITLTVAKEPEKVEIPDVVGSSERAARSALRKAGFEPAVRQVDVSSEADDGKVTGQSPDGGEERSKGARVTLEVGRFEPTAPDASPTPSPTPAP